MDIKCFVGDLYLINQQLNLADVDINSPFSFREVRDFGEDEYSFIFSYSLFSTGVRALLYRTDKLEANEYLLKAIMENTSENFHLFIVCEELIKGRKLYNALNKLKCIQYFELDVRKFREIGKSYGLSGDVIDAIMLRCGFVRSLIAGSDLASWCKNIVALGANVDAVYRVVPENRQNSVWVLKDSLIAGDLTSVMEISDTIISQTDNTPIGILSAVLFEFRVAYKLSLFKDNPSKAFNALESKRRVNKNLNSFSAKQLGAVFNLLTSAIANMKMGYEPIILMKNTFVECVSILYGDIEQMK